MEYQHVPVMLKEALEYLGLKKGKNYIDCTLGGAGYTSAIAKAINPGLVLSIDEDELAIENAKKIIKKANIKNIVLAHDNFSNLEQIIEQTFEGKAPKFSGIVLDLGLSSAQLVDRSRGFSFSSDSPLDMSFGPSKGGGSKTMDIVNQWKEGELTRILREYGEEKFAFRIAKNIVAARAKKPISTTKELVEIIERSIPKSNRRKPGIHFATRTFQALRIATNEELEVLKNTLNTAVKILETGGKIVVISYHSLEDRIVKQFFREQAKDCICPPELPFCRCDHRSRVKILTKNIVEPSAEEVSANPRARSAKLRAAEIIKQIEIK